MMNSLIKTLIPTILFSVTLLGCLKPAEKADIATSAEPTVNHQTAPQAASTDTPATPATIKATYACDNGKTIIALYDNSQPDQSKVTLTIDGKDYQLTQAVSASGARYSTEQGLNPDQGLDWHTKGQEATASTITLDHTAKAEDEKTLFSCNEKSA